MKYDIEKYLDCARTLYSGLPPFIRFFCGCISYWKLGNIFDTMTEYLLVSKDPPDGIAKMVYDFHAKLPGACWYDDYAWWGLASSKAFDPAYDHIFDVSKPDFQNLAIETWGIMNKGAPERPLTHGAPNVWDKCIQADFTKYPDSWAKPRIQGGVWQYDMFKKPPRPSPPECSSYNPSDPCSPPGDPYVTLGPFQNTVVNVLYLLLAGRLQSLGVVADPDPGAAFEREYSFLDTWSKLDLISYINGNACLVRERVPTYDQPAGSSDWPKVRAYYPDAFWCGDQGLLMAGLNQYYMTNNPNDPMRTWWAKAFVLGVLAQLTTDGIVQPLTAPNGFYNDVGDFPDYLCGSGVFMRYLLLVFQNNPDLKNWLLGFIKIPEQNFIYKSAEDACNYDPTKYHDCGEILFDIFNRIATLTTAYVILGEAN